MDLNAFMKRYAHEIGGQYYEYDRRTSIIIVPLPDARFQTVLGKIRESVRYNCLGIEFFSKVCIANTGMDLRSLLEENANLNHAKFAIAESFIHVEASSFLESATEELLKEIIQEVANVADEYELKLTGQDVQ